MEDRQSNKNSDSDSDSHCAECSSADDLHDDDDDGGSATATGPSTPASSCSFFAHRKQQCLGKRDKSSAGRLDPGAVDICALLNALPQYYTTSSCAGRCFLYVGPGIKATDAFQRVRVSHQGITDAPRYFDFNTLTTDPTGGGDAVKEFDGGRRERVGQAPQSEEKDPVTVASLSSFSSSSSLTSIWLRYEPFILHVACRSLEAAATLLATARPTFKNVGLTTWKNDSSAWKRKNYNNKYLVAIWGDEGLDMPLTNQDGVTMVGGAGFSVDFLAQLVNQRHERNAHKIARLVEAVRHIVPDENNEDAYYDDKDHENDNNNSKTSKIPRSYDVIGDIAVLHSISTNDPVEQQAIGTALLQRNKALRIVALRTSNLSGTERSPTLQILAGAHREPLLTTHREYGIACLVDVQRTFFTPRLGPERLRICQQTARGEHVLVLFAGVALEALQLVARTQAASVTAIELNPVAVQCAQRSQQLLQRNVKGVPCPGAAERLRIVAGDCLEILPTLPRNHYHRILAPRPKEGSRDGNQPSDTGTTDDDDTSLGEAGGVEFLEALLPVLKQDGGECHWYDFAADHEFPQCERTVRLLTRACHRQGLALQVLHVAHAGNIAMRQLRVCVDFCVSPLSSSETSHNLPMETKD